MPATSQPVALVTGASRGIGRAIALQLAHDGYAIAINHVSPTPHAESLLQEIESAGGKAHILRADISQPTDRANLIKGIQQHFGRLDFLVNNAGVAPTERRSLLDATEESCDRLLAINLKGPHFLTQLASKWMIDLQSSGTIPKARICFITSISAYTISTNRADYCISKAALSMSASLWAAELAQHNIPVLEVRPGIIATDMTAGVKEKYDQLIAQGVFPQKRWGTPQDVAAVVSAIGRGDFDYSTGITIDVSGGFQLKRL
jgi:3-oxoacyl-[acyl-carrier protein] reductase